LDFITSCESVDVVQISREPYPLPIACDEDYILELGQVRWVAIFEIPAHRIQVARGQAADLGVGDLDGDRSVGGEDGDWACLLMACLR
jgi:hypothetical protein